VATGDATSLLGMAMWAATGMVSGLGAAFARKRKKK
jgi:LPXTG-motif cell wall-anchored protein